MNTERPDLEALLDGPDDALEAALREDPTLAEAVALQQAIDDSLRRSFALPDLEAVHQRLEEAAEVRAVVSPTVAQPLPRPSWLANPVWTIAATAAAIVLMVLLGKWRLDQTRGDERGPVAMIDPPVAVVDPPVPSAGASTRGSRWIDLYRGLPADGFGPPTAFVIGGGPDGVSCASDGSSALVMLPSPGLEVRSECSDQPPCAQWGVEASRVFELSVDPQGVRVLVFVYAAMNDPRPAVPAGSKFYMHRRQLGHLVLYELSPMSRAVGLPAFEL